jgi:hypothetical protein
MKCVDNFNNIELAKGESFISSCDNCGKFRIVNHAADIKSREFIKDYYGVGHGEWVTHFLCCCGEPFSIQD